MILTEEAVVQGRRNILDELDEVRDRLGSRDEKLLKLESIVRSNESLNESLTFETIDSYLPYFYDKPDSFFNYVENYLFILDDVKKTEGKIDSILSLKKTMNPFY